MKPFDYFIYCFKNYAKFSGRARRSEFWFFQLFNFIISIAISTAAQTFSWVTDSWAVLGFSCLYSFAVIVPSLAVTVRRLHDTGRSGWWLLSYYIPNILTFTLFIVVIVQIISENSFYQLDNLDADSLPWTTIWACLLSLLVTFVFSIVILVWLCTDSHPGTNKYGPNPKGVEDITYQNTSHQSPFSGSTTSPKTPRDGSKTGQEPQHNSSQGFSQPSSEEGHYYQKDPYGGNSHYQK